MNEDLPAKKHDDEINLIDLIRVIWNGRILVAVATCLFLLGSVVTALLLPRSYEATTAVLPISSNSGSSGLSQLAGLAGLAGVSLPVSGGNSPEKTINALLASRLLASRVVEEMNLVPIFLKGAPTTKEQVGYSPLIRATLAFQRLLKTKDDVKTGMLNISVTYSDPQLALDMANKTAEVLDKLLSERALTSSEREGADLDKQVAEQEVKLQESQNRLATFQKQTSLLDPKSQASSSLTAYGSLVQQKMGLEVQLATYSNSLSNSNPRITALKAQIESIDGQIADVKNQVGGDLPSLKQAPENFIKFQNLSQDLEIATKIYATLIASREQVRLTQQQDKIYVSVIDPALLGPPKPSRTVVVAVGTFLGLFLGILAVFVRLGWVDFRKRFNNESDVTAANS